MVNGVTVNYEWLMTYMLDEALTINRYTINHFSILLPSFGRATRAMLYDKVKDGQRS